MSSKIRSPPPKPPRRRFSDAVSPTGTYPSTRKKYQDEKSCLEDDLSISDNNRCESLPANWNKDFSIKQNIETEILTRNSSLSSSTFLNNSKMKFQCPINCIENNNSLSTNFSESIIKKTLPDQNRNNDIYSESAMENNFCPLKCLNNLHEDKHCDKNSCFNTTSTKLDLKSFSADYHKRHHSDPVLSFLDKSNTKTVLHKHALRSHSFLSSFNEKKRFCNYLTSSKSKEYKYLYEEMKNLKEINTKLWEQLCCTQACLDKVTKNSEEIETLSLSDLLSSLYYSQKTKDNAMEDRINVIMEERDIAIQELDEMVNIIARSFENETILEEDKYSEKGIKDILKDIESTYNPSKLLQQQRLLLTYIYHSKELKQDRIMHELKVAIRERDHLHEKVKDLEEELKSQQVSSDVWNSDNKHWENNLLKILCQVIQQRDVALSQVIAVQNSETLSNDIDNPIKRNFETLYDKKCEQTPLDSSTDEVRMLKSEILFLSKALENETLKKEHLENKCYRLERLVNVLRKKVNGQNVGIPV